MAGTAIIDDQARAIRELLEDIGEAVLLCGASVVAVVGTRDRSPGLYEEHAYGDAGGLTITIATADLPEDIGHGSTAEVRGVRYEVAGIQTGGAATTVELE